MCPFRAPLAKAGLRFASKRSTSFFVPKHEFACILNVHQLVNLVHKIIFVVFYVPMFAAERVVVF